MTQDLKAPWHKVSFDAFFNDYFPRLLGERLPLAGYAFLPQDNTHCQVSVEIANGTQTIRVDYLHLPQMDEDGLFSLEGKSWIVVPVASGEEFDRAEILCAGELLHQYVTTRIGTPPAGLEWDESMVRAFLPLDQWIHQFLKGSAQILDTTNWHSRQTHLRRILIPRRTRVVAPGQMGRVDPFETPEGPNIGRVFTIALGAEIRDGKLVITDSSPAAGLGPNAALIPFLEHDDANRLLMGDNMMRQALVPETAEPALVQTGREPNPAGPDLWCGRNLLTAFIAWGEGSVEDGLVISQSCAQRLDYPYPAEPGDKLSNRHGTKGVISQVLPDDEMPHLSDGTPVEICFSFTGLHTRGNFGQLLEAVMGKIARAEGRPAVVPSFHAPSQAQIRNRLTGAGFSEDGMEQLFHGKDGPALDYPSTVGWVYWYRLVHLARGKERAVAGQVTRETFAAAQPLGDWELNALCKIGARMNALEIVTTRSAVGQAPGFPSPWFRHLAARLSAAGIAVHLSAGRLQFSFQPPQGETLTLAREIPHPWFPEAALKVVGAPPAESISPLPLEAGTPTRRAFAALCEASEALSRRLADHAPARLVNDTSARVEGALLTYLDGLLPASTLRLNEPQRFSARAVISPAVGLSLEQVGLPESIFRAFYPGEGKDPNQPGGWVLLTREPAVTPTSLIAFHPVMVEGSSIRLHPQACELLNADFDGDQVSVFLPLSSEAQAEAGDKLSIAGHLARDSEQINALISPHEGLWGTAYRSLTPSGREEIARILDCPVERLSSPVILGELSAALHDLRTRRGILRASQAAETLMRFGYAAAKQSGASLHPFAHSQVPLPPAPETDDPEVWEAYLELCAETVHSARGYLDPNLGPQLLSTAVPVRQRSRRLLPLLVGPRGPVTGPDGEVISVRSSLVEGRAPEELYATVAGARLGLAKISEEGEKILQEPPTGAAHTILARARRSRHPGIVFAAAAAGGETDPLSDEETRLLVGLPPVVP